MSYSIVLHFSFPALRHYSVLNPLYINNSFLKYTLSLFFSPLSLVKNLIVLILNDMGQVPVNIGQNVQALFELRCTQDKMKVFFVLVGGILICPDYIYNWVGVARTCICWW